VIIEPVGEVLDAVRIEVVKPLPEPDGDGPTVIVDRIVGVGIAVRVILGAVADAVLGEVPVGVIAPREDSRRGVGTVRDEALGVAIRSFAWRSFPSVAPTPSIACSSGTSYRRFEPQCERSPSRWAWIRPGTSEYISPDSLSSTEGIRPS
jgi:hypothetical protein